MSETSETDVAEIRAHVQSILDDAEESVSEVYLFGSQARGDARPDSDVDVALVDPAFADVPMAARGIWFKREWDYTGVGPLELFCLTPEEYAERLDAGQSTVTNIENEGVRLDSEVV
jgi:hypothetical protein